jgi:predicted acetyltransferase
MIESDEVALELATADSAPVLSNLLELYIHDLSEIFAVEVGADGRFGYERLAGYWADPDNRLAFLIRYRARLAGFVLVTRGSPATEDPAVFDVAEFFILRYCRRSGIGGRAASQLWSQLPGQWIVRVSEANHAGVGFWERTIQEYTGGAFLQREYRGKGHRFRVFSFGRHLGSPAV